MNACVFLFWKLYFKEFLLHRGATTLQSIDKKNSKDYSIVRVQNLLVFLRFQKYANMDGYIKEAFDNIQSETNIDFKSLLLSFLTLSVLCYYTVVNIIGRIVVDFRRFLLLESIEY